MIQGIPAAIRALPLIEKIGVLLMGGMLAKDAVLKPLELGLNYKGGKRQSALQGMMARAQIDAAKAENEANRADTQKYLGMLRDARDREGIESSRDRQMQLVMAMLAGTGNYRQQTSSVMREAGRTMPPMALTTLMRGM